MFNFDSRKPHALLCSFEFWFYVSILPFHVLSGFVFFVAIFLLTFFKIVECCFSVVIRFFVKFSAFILFIFILQIYVSFLFSIKVKLFIHIFIFSQTEESLYVAKSSLSCYGASIIQLVRPSTEYKLSRCFSQPYSKIRSTTMYRPTFPCNARTKGYTLWPQTWKRSSM